MTMRASTCLGLFRAGKPTSHVAITLVTALVATILCAGAFGQGQSPTEKKFFRVKPAVAGNYMVILPVGTEANAVEEIARTLIKRYGGELTHVYAVDTGSLRGFAISGVRERAALELASDPRVRFVEEVAHVFSTWTRANPGWALDRIGHRTNTPAGVFHYSADGTGVRAYVLDDGIEVAHPEFAGNLVQLGVDTFHGTGDSCDGHGTAMAA
jgi:hypothetical protein